jgi:hypothetical protein
LDSESLAWCFSLFWDFGVFGFTSDGPVSLTSLGRFPLCGAMEVKDGFYKRKEKKGGRERDLYTIHLQYATVNDVSW